MKLYRLGLEYAKNNPPRYDNIEKKRHFKDTLPIKDLDEFILGVYDGNSIMEVENEN